MAERIRAEIEKQRDKALPAYTVSLGVAVFKGGKEGGANNAAANIESLIDVADAALYRAKSGGRNQVVA